LVYQLQVLSGELVQNHLWHFADGFIVIPFFEQFPLPGFQFLLVHTTLQQLQLNNIKVRD
jgi:hypothetical protein